MPSSLVIRMFAISCKPGKESVASPSVRGPWREASSGASKKMVGTTGFEPATSRTPSVRATRLRHVPTAPTQFSTGCTALPRHVSVSPAFEQRQQCLQRVPQIEQYSAADAGRGIFLRPRIAVRLAAVAALLPQVPASAGDGEPFVVEQPLDLQHGFDVLAAVEPVAFGTFHRLEHREFGLPVAQHEGLGGGQPAHLADAEKALLGDLGSALAVAWHRC